MTETLGEVLIEAGLAIERVIQQPGFALPDSTTLNAIEDTKTALFMLALRIDMLPARRTRRRQNAGKNRRFVRVQSYHLRQDSLSPKERKRRRQQLRECPKIKLKRQVVLPDGAALDNSYTVAQVCRILKKSRYLVNALCDTGRLKFFRLGDFTPKRIAKSEVERFLAHRA